jgi:chemotaxis protein CheD
MGSNRIKIGMGEGVVACGPHVVSSTGIGSCVVVTLYDAKRKAGAMAHVMLPDSAALCEPSGSFQCADTAIKLLLEGLQDQGSLLLDLVAKIAGGARMFSTYDEGTNGIGSQNIRRIKDILQRNRIPLTGWDVDGRHGRSVDFHLTSGNLVVKSFGTTDKVF